MPAPKGNQHAKGSKGGTGRPTSYRPEYVARAALACEAGFTDKEIADLFGVHETTLYDWKLAHVDFCLALKIGKAPADNRVERSLFHRAVGYSYIEEVSSVDKKTGEIYVEEVRKHVPPDVTACIYWTKNRRPEQWRERRNEDEAPGGNGGIQISGGFSGTVTVQKNGDQVSDPAPEPAGSVRGISEES
jgi:hypothetical protein